MNAYQLKAAIKNQKPPIWRRCIVPGGITYSQISLILTGIMGSEEDGRLFNERNRVERG